MVRPNYCPSPSPPTRRSITRSSSRPPPAHQLLTNDPAFRLLRANGQPQPNAFCIGNAAKGPLSSNAQVAIAAGQICAYNVAASISNTPPLPFKLTDLGEMMTLGDTGVVAAFGGRVQIMGEAASVVRKLVYDARMPTWGQPQERENILYKYVAMVAKQERRRASRVV